MTTSKFKHRTRTPVRPHICHPPPPPPPPPPTYIAWLDPPTQTIPAFGSAYGELSGYFPTAPPDATFELEWDVVSGSIEYPFQCTNGQIHAWKYNCDYYDATLPVACTFHFPGDIHVRIEVEVIVEPESSSGS